MPVPYFDTAKEYVEYLEDTLIPDLKDSGRRSTALDLEEAIYWILAASPSKAKSKKSRKGKMSPYNKFVKDNASKPRFKYKSGKMKGRVNMKKIAQAWKKTAAYKRSRK